MGGRLSAQELGRRLDRILGATERLIAGVPDARMDDRLPPQDRTLRDLAYHVFRLALAFAEGMDRGRLSREWLAEPAPVALRDGRAIARYGALVRGRLTGWFEGAAPREFERTIDGYDGPLSGHDLLARSTAHAAQHLRQLHASLEGLAIPPRVPLPVEDFAGLGLPDRLW